MLILKTDHTYKCTAQGNLRMWVYSAEGYHVRDARPAIIFFSGSDWVTANVERFSRQALYLAQRGMVAACAEYRVTLQPGVTIEQCVADAQSAVRWLRAQARRLGVDPEAIVVAGDSAGGYLAACTALVPGHEAIGEGPWIATTPNALALFSPVLDLETLPTDTLARLGSEEMVRALALTEHLHPDLPPMLVMHGTADQTAPFSQAEALVNRLGALGVRAELFRAQGQPHGFWRRSPWYEHTLYRLDEFLNELGYLSGAPTIALPEDDLTLSVGEMLR